MEYIIVIKIAIMVCILLLAIIIKYQDYKLQKQLKEYKKRLGR